ncbi:MAG: hypothetical protein JNL58_18905 [Planctomyces sp.]|nr:hypothetical protein [Planctomyces sp.]
MRSSFRTLIVRISKIRMPKFGNRKIISLAILGSICALIVPFPVVLRGVPLEGPAGSSETEKEAGEAFPCQDRPCGCRTAKQCWKQCCCFTNAQKIAWAKSRGVQVPDFVVVAAANEMKSEGSKKSCCSRRVEKVEGSKDLPRRKYVIGIMAEECQGLNWLMASVPVVSSQPLQLIRQNGCEVYNLIDVTSETLPEMPTDATRLPPRIG